MGMKRKRAMLSLFFVFMWVFLFLLGIYVVFLFLNGFSFFDSRVLQKGYASFSSESPLYLDGKYVENSERYSQYEIGEYIFCIEEFAKKTRCYDDVDISSNEEVSQELKSIFLLPSEGNDISYVLSEKNDLFAFSSDKRALLWYSNSLRQGFYVEENTGEISSFFSLLEVVSLEYNERLKRFELRGVEDEESFNIETSSIALQTGGEYDFERRFFSLVLGVDGFFKEVVLELSGVFLNDLERWYSLKDGRFVLFFKDSIYLFSPVRNSFQFLSVKDSDFPGVCTVESEKCFYVRDKLIRFISL